MASKGEVEVRAVCPECDGEGTCVVFTMQEVRSHILDKVQAPGERVQCWTCKGAKSVPVTLDAEALREVVAKVCESHGNMIRVNCPGNATGGQWHDPADLLAALCPSPEATDGKE